MSTTVGPAARRPPGAMSLAAFTSSVDRFGISPLLVIIAAEFGVSLGAAVLTASLYFLAYGLTQPLWGILSDKFGRLPIMRIALLGAIVCGMISAFAPTLTFLTVTRALTGAFFGAIIPASITYIGDTVSGSHRQSALSDLMAAVAVGTASATAAAGILGEVLSWRVVFAGAAALALISLIPLLRLQEPARVDATGVVAGLRLFFRHKWALFVVGVAFVEGAVVLGILTLLAPALESQSVATSLAGLAVAAYGVGTWGFSRLVRPLTRWFSAPRPSNRRSLPGRRVGNRRPAPVCAHRRDFGRAVRRSVGIYAYRTANMGDPGCAGSSGTVGRVFCRGSICRQRRQLSSWGCTGRDRSVDRDFCHRRGDRGGADHRRLDRLVSVPVTTLMREAIYCANFTGRNQSIGISHVSV